jgi:hypothetical protein
MAGSRKRAIARVQLVVLALALSLSALRGDGLLDIRAQAGARLFRAFLSADVDVDKKTVDNNQLLVLFFYNQDRSRADALAAHFKGDAKDGGTIRGLPISVATTNDATLNAFKSRVPAGIFLAQPPSEANRRALIRYGIEHHVIVYSPFEGDVESGVLGGLSVEAQVRPYVNLATLTASNISLKPLFFKVTKVYR